MSLGVLAVNVLIGVIFVLLWGVLTYIASSDAEFKSFFIGGLANFVFFIGGVLASYLAQFVSPSSQHVGNELATQPLKHSTFSVVGALYIAMITTVSVVVVNVFLEGFTLSLSKIEQLRTVAFAADGYRDIQIFATGSFGMLCFAAALIYGLYLGAVRPGTTYLTVLGGVVMSLGVQGLLYVLFGLFFGYQVFQILAVSSPPILGTFGPAAQKLFGLGITTATAFFFAIFWTTSLWCSIKLGSFVSRLPSL